MLRESHFINWSIMGICTSPSLPPSCSFFIRPFISSVHILLKHALSHLLYYFSLCFAYMCAIPSSFFCQAIRMLDKGEMVDAKLYSNMAAAQLALDK